jgi:hypothetical protein
MHVSNGGLRTRWGDQVGEDIQNEISMKRVDTDIREALMGKQRRMKETPMR